MDKAQLDALTNRNIGSVKSSGKSTLIANQQTDLYFDLYFTQDWATN